jgi:hypothetical protein
LDRRLGGHQKLWVWAGPNAVEQRKELFPLSGIEHLPSGSQTVAVPTELFRLLFRLKFDKFYSYIDPKNISLLLGYKTHTGRCFGDLYALGMCILIFIM